MRPTRTLFSKKSGIAGVLVSASLLACVIITEARAGTLFITIDGVEHERLFTPTVTDTAQIGSANLFGTNGLITTESSFTVGLYTLSNISTASLARVTFSDGASNSVDVIDLTNLLITKNSSAPDDLTIGFGYDFRFATAQTAPVGKAVQMTVDGSFSATGGSISTQGFLTNGILEIPTTPFANLSDGRAGTAGVFGPPTPSTFTRTTATCASGFEIISCQPVLTATATINLAANGSQLRLPGSIGLASADEVGLLPSISNVPEGSSSTLLLLGSGVLGVWLLRRRFAM